MSTLKIEYRTNPDGTTSKVAVIEVPADKESVVLEQIEYLKKTFPGMTIKRVPLDEPTKV